MTKTADNTSVDAGDPIGFTVTVENGGPGTATESLTLQAYVAWRTLDLGGSAAVAYSLLFVVTVVGVAYVNLVRARVTEAGR